MITHDYRLIFVHIPKCAGRSVCDMFNQRFDHYTANLFATEYKKFFDYYDSFSIVRNPFDRMVSLYIYIKNHRRHAKEDIALHRDGMPPFEEWLAVNIYNYQGDFPMSSPEGLRGTDGDVGSSFWFSSQVRRLQDANGKIIVGTVIKLEGGTKAVEDYLFDKTGLRQAMPHSNKSEYDNYQDFYTSELVELALNFGPIKEDCEAFNYQF